MVVMVVVVVKVSLIHLLITTLLWEHCVCVCVCVGVCVSVCLYVCVCVYVCSIDTMGVINRVSELFDGHTELIVGFSSCLQATRLRWTQRVMLSVSITRDRECRPLPDHSDQLSALMRSACLASLCSQFSLKCQMCQSQGVHFTA